MAKRRKSAEAGKTAIFKVDGWTAHVPAQWRHSYQRGIYGYDREDSLWCARLYYNEKGLEEAIPSAPDGSPAAGIKVGIGVPVITWGPFMSVISGCFDGGGLRAGQALAFGNNASAHETGQRWRRYGFIKELSEKQFQFSITNTVSDAVKLGELRRQELGIDRRILTFSTEAPLVKQLATLAAVWGGIEILAVALDFMLDQGIGGAALEPVPKRTKQIGDQALENRERMKRELEELQERVGAVQREMAKQGFHIDPAFVRRYSQEDAVATESFLLRQQNADLREMLEGMVRRHNDCGTEMPWDGRGGPDPLLAVQRFLHQR